MGSRLRQLRRLTPRERRELLTEASGLDAAELGGLVAGLSVEHADQMVENVVGCYQLPLGIATNFQVNGRDCLVPMAIEEPSVVAAASYGAKLAREAGGFHAEASAPNMIAQVHVRVSDTRQALQRLTQARPEIEQLANEALPRLCARGGGVRDVEVRALGIGRIALHLIIDCRDAMGANMVNTAAEHVAARVAEIADGSVSMRILSNLSDQRMVRIGCRVPVSALRRQNREGLEVAEAIEEASRIAELDPYRASTHNKGIFNGLDAVVMATGNDWRAVEAGAHAYAARRGRYEPLAIWRVEGDHLVGTLEMPLAVGIVGAALRTHEGAKAALKLMGVESAQELASIAAAAGLACNLAALRALTGEGIQQGHMALHNRAGKVHHGTR